MHNDMRAHAPGISGVRRLGGQAIGLRDAPRGYTPGCGDGRRGVRDQIALHCRLEVVKALREVFVQWLMEGGGHCPVVGHELYVGSRSMRSRSPPGLPHTTSVGSQTQNSDECKAQRRLSSQKEASLHPSLRMRTILPILLSGHARCMLEIPACRAPPLPLAAWCYICSATQLDFSAHSPRP